MKVGETGRTSGPVSVRRARARAKAEEAPPAAPRKVADTVSIMGIPEIELTPKVRAAIVTLMAEVESLRHEVEHTPISSDSLIRTRWRRSPTVAPSCAN